MLAAMNGHVAAVKLLLDRGSDVNAQIETNRNTALTLACFQGRTEVVGLLLDRHANVEHRAKVIFLNIFRLFYFLFYQNDRKVGTFKLSVNTQKTWLSKPLLSFLYIARKCKKTKKTDNLIMEVDHVFEIGKTEHSTLTSAFVGFDDLVYCL